MTRRILLRESGTVHRPVGIRGAFAGFDLLGHDNSGYDEVRKLKVVQRSSEQEKSNWCSGSDDEFSVCLDEKC